MASGASARRGFFVGAMQIGRRGGAGTLFHPGGGGVVPSAQKTYPEAPS
jgi:hypothetical protein